MSSKLVGLHEVNGVLVPDFVSQDVVDKMKDMELYPDDVWVVTYPKCGTTWTQQIVRLIRNNGEKDDVKIDDAVPWPEECEINPICVDDKNVLFLKYEDMKRDLHGAVSQIAAFLEAKLTSDIIGASLSEPHTSELAGEKSVYLSVCQDAPTCCVLSHGPLRESLVRQ